MKIKVDRKLAASSGVKKGIFDRLCTQMSTIGQKVCSKYCCLLFLCNRTAAFAEWKFATEKHVVALRLMFLFLLVKLDVGYIMFYLILP